MHSIRFQVMKKALISVLLSMAVCCVALSAYSFYNLQKTLVSDAVSILRQAGEQIGFMLTDADRLTASVTADDTMQNLIRDWNKTSGNNNMASIQIRQRLRWYATQRNYIYSLDYIDKNHRVLHSSAMYGDKSNDMDALLTEPWFTEFEKSEEKRITSPIYKAWSIQSTYNTLTNPSSLISKVFKVKSLSDSKAQMGYIMVTVDISQFDSIAESLMKDFSEIMILSPGKEVVSNTVSGKRKACLPQLISTIMNAKSSSVRLSDGFMVYVTDDDQGWTIAGLISMSRLKTNLYGTLMLVVLFLLGSVGLTMLLMWPLVGKITRRVTNLSHHIVEISKGNFDTRIAALHEEDELEVMGACFNQMAADLKQSIETRIEGEREKKDVEYRLLLTQLNPHFIYNTIDIAVFLLRMNRVEAAEEMLSSFVEILQNTVCLGEDTTKSTVEKEVTLVKCYMEVLNFRSGKQIQLDIRVDEDTLPAFLPKFFLQPFVENAVSHGFARKEENCKILLRIERRGEMLCVLIEDNGEGMTEDVVDRLLEGKEIKTDGVHHISIHNLYTILHMSFGDKMTFHIESTCGSGTRIYIEIPFLESK